MNRRPILALAMTALLAATLVTPAAAATPQAANSQQKPNDAFVDVHDFVFDNGESLASLKLHYLTLGTPRRDASVDVRQQLSDVPEQPRRPGSQSARPPHAAVDRAW